MDRKNLKQDAYEHGQDRYFENPNALAESDGNERWVDAWMDTEGEDGFKNAYNIADSELDEAITIYESEANRGWNDAQLGN